MLLATCRVLRLGCYFLNYNGDFPNLLAFVLNFFRGIECFFSESRK
jgi:hypothetical protein